MTTTRIELLVPSDLTLNSFQWAVSQLIATSQGACVVDLLTVHPFGKHLAMKIVWEHGCRCPVVADNLLSENEWIVHATSFLNDGDFECHSPGA